MCIEPEDSERLSRQKESGVFCWIDRMKKKQDPCAASSPTYTQARPTGSLYPKSHQERYAKLLGQMPYERFSVAALCRPGRDHSGHLYLHYLSLDLVLNELLDEAVFIADNVCARMSFEERMKYLASIFVHGSVQDLKEKACLLAPCRRIVNVTRYRVLFQSPAGLCCVLWCGMLSADRVPPVFAPVKNLLEGSYPPIQRLFHL